MGRIVTGYFGTYCSVKNDMGNYFDTLHDAGVSNFSDGDRHSILKCQGMGVYAGAGISNNNSGKYWYNRYGHSVDASSPAAPGTPRGIMLSDHPYSGFGTFTPTTSTGAEDIVEMASDEYPTNIKFISLPLYRNEGMVSGDPGNGWTVSSPSVLLYAFKNDFSEYTYENGKRTWNEEWKRDIVKYDPRAGAVILYNESSKRSYFHPTDTTVFRQYLGDAGKGLQGKKLGLFRDGGVSWTQWRGFHKVEITTEYVSYLVTVEQGVNGSGIILEGGGVPSISAFRDNKITLKSNPEDGYVSTGWTITSGSGRIDSKDENNYVFTMGSPAKNTIVKPTFKKKVFSITITEPVGGEARCNVSSSEWDEYPRLSYEENNSLYRFNGWEVRDENNTIIPVSPADDGSGEYVFKMPKSNVTVTAHFLKHEIAWTRCNLTIEQDNYTLTFIKDDDVYDTFGESVIFKLYRGNTYITDFNDDFATVTLTDSQIGTSYNYELRAYNAGNQSISATPATYRYAVYRVTLESSPSEAGSVYAMSNDNKEVLVAEPLKKITLGYELNSLYVFSNWTSSDGITITGDKFTMPEKNVTITAVFAKHIIKWDNATLTVEQSEYKLTFTKGGTVSDSKNIPFGFKLLRNGVDLGVTFNGDTATYRMTDAEVEKEYEYTVVAYSLKDEIFTAGATITYRSLAVHKTIGYFNGEEFVPCIPYYYNGEDWVEVYPYYFDGTNWQLCSMT